jgi:RNA polymerase sigma factor (TIGR02999 family)
MTTREETPGDTVPTEQTKREAAIAGLLPVVYAELRALAQQRIAAEAPGHTLQATALVHEAFLRLAQKPNQNLDCPAYFFAAAAEAMRIVLIDHARSRGCVKRGGGLKQVPLGVADLAGDVDPEQILSMDGAIKRFEKEHPEVAEIVRLRFFAGLSVEKTAEVLGISRRTVDREWSFARAWLYRNLEQSGEL